MRIQEMQEAGFSLVEVLVVIGLLLITSGIVVTRMKTTVSALDADNASNLVSSEFAYARQLAVDQRRNMIVSFQGSNEIKVTRQELDGSTTMVSDVSLPAGYTFGFPAGIGDTPDKFLAGSTLYTSAGTGGTAVYIGPGTTGKFMGDGTFADNSNVLVNGSVFTRSSDSWTARAVTVSGATGKLKQYGLKGTIWVVK